MQATARPVTPGIEQQMLELADGVGPGSRLACQIKVNADLDGLILKMPHGQH